MIVWDKNMAFLPRAPV